LKLESHLIPLITYYYNLLIISIAEHLNSVAAFYAVLCSDLLDYVIFLSV